MGAEGQRCVRGPGGLVPGAQPVCPQADQRPGRGGAGGGASSEPQRGSQGGRPGRAAGPQPKQAGEETWWQTQKGEGAGRHREVGTRMREQREIKGTVVEGQRNGGLPGSEMKP